MPLCCSSPVLLPDMLDGIDRCHRTLFEYSNWWGGFGGHVETLAGSSIAANRTAQDPPCTWRLPVDWTTWLAHTGVSQTCIAWSIMDLQCTVVLRLVVNTIRLLYHSLGISLVLSTDQQVWLSNSWLLCYYSSFVWIGSPIRTDWIHEGVHMSMAWYWTCLPDYYIAEYSSSVNLFVSTNECVHRYKIEIWAY